ncbi:MAG: TadE/TadG family type IV pilus assembly protein [Limnochordia bacterium]|jgi:hypothetical protein|nr:pilus assembly protein [Bacillota bacterium]
MVRREEGQAMVELAITLSLLLLILLGVMEFGRLGHAYLVVTHAAREGARVAALGYGDDIVEQRVLDAAGTLDGTKLEVAVAPGTRVRGEGVMVQVSYPVEIIAPLIQQIVPSPVIVRGRTTMRVE